MEIRIVIRPVKRAKLLFFLFFLSLNVVAQIDTLIVRGKVENLSLTLYQQAPNISITRVNILQPNREIVRVVQLQPDGSFELKMPLVYPKEECRLYYAHHSVSFLGENGLVEIILYGDSLTKSDTPFKFRGRNAHTNNRHALWEANFSKWLKTNPEKPEKSKDALSFWENTLVEQNRRIAFYQQFATSNDLLLTTWVLSSLQEAAKAHFFAYLAQEKAPLPLNLPTLAPLDTTLLLTFAKADCYYQFTQHATATVPSITNGALPIEMLARLILQYVLHLSEDDHQKLTDIAAGKRAKMTDLKWLNGLFKKEEEVLTYISLYELYLKNYGAAYSFQELDYLKGAFYTNNLYNFTTDKMTLWYRHIHPTLSNAYYQYALDEIYHIESQDTLRLNQAKEVLYTLDNNRKADQYSIDLTSTMHIYKDFSKNGAQLWKEIRDKTQDKAIYAIFWTNDTFGRRALAESLQLRATLLQEKVAFVYLSEYTLNEDVWLENIVKSNAPGLHVKLDKEQSDFFAEDWRISRVPHSVFVDARGKYIDRNAPLPADREGWEALWAKMAR